MAATEITTERLKLREWRSSDRDEFARMNADPEVTRHFPAPLSRQQSDTMAQRIVDHIAKNQFGLWAVEVLGGAPFIGFIGLCIPRFEAHFTPCVEIGWRLAKEHWQQGFATEGARACIQFGFDKLQLDEIVAMTIPANRPSRRVMEKLGMSHNPADDFDHPLVDPDSPMYRHVLYRLKT